jgi:hypothetical protein
MTKPKSKENQDVAVTDWRRALLELDEALKNAQIHVHKMEQVVTALRAKSA